MPGTVCSGHFYPNAAHFQIKWKLASPLKQTDTKMEKRLPKMGSLLRSCKATEIIPLP